MTKLNKQQLDAIKTDYGPYKIIAGAGTGKTTVLVEHIKYLINEKNIPLKDIVVMVFNRKARDEIKNRLQVTINEDNDFYDDRA